MKIIKFDIDADYGHFKIPYTNNNPLTHSFITKTALLGMIGAVLGIEREDMKPLYPILSDSLKYSVVLRSPLEKESVSLYTKNLDNFWKADRESKTPKPMELLKKPSYTVYVVVVDGERVINEQTKETVNMLMDKFIYHVEDGIYVWQPSLGVKNCPCELSNMAERETETYDGDFQTLGFVTKITEETDSIVFADDMPTHQNEFRFNDPAKYVAIKFTDDLTPLRSTGVHYKFNGEAIFGI
jgi:CRISPR-associated protein Cas5h